MRFISARSATALRAPTRASVLAGGGQWQTVLEWGFGLSTLREGQMSVGSLMQNAGHRTVILGEGTLVVKCTESIPTSDSRTISRRACFHFGGRTESRATS